MLHNGVMAQLRREQKVIEAMHRRPWWRVGVLHRRPWRKRWPSDVHGLWDWLTKTHDCSDPMVGCSCTDGFRFPASKPLPTKGYTPTIAIDFDGVIHQYISPWTLSHEIHDPPVEGAFEFLQGCVDEGFKIAIYTARVNDPGVVPHIIQWFKKYALPDRVFDAMTITALKPGAVIYIDDRGWRFEGLFPSFEKIRSLKQWNKG
jgi:hypothetical protein